MYQFIQTWDIKILARLSGVTLHSSLMYSKPAVHVMKDLCMSIELCFNTLLQDIMHYALAAFNHLNVRTEWN